MGNLKKRSPIVAFFLSLITPGLGQMYNGKLKKGTIFFIAAECLLILLHIFSTLRFKFHGLILFWVCVIFLLGFLLFILLDALFGINKPRLIVLKPYHKWYFYAIIAIVIFLTNEFILEPMLPDIRSFKAYKIPSKTMEPALLVGDRLIADRIIYKKQKPKRGDVIIFEHPKDPSKDFIKRVIGLEGEKVEIVNNKVYIDDKMIDDPWGYHESGVLPKHMQELEKFGPVLVPQASLFVLGDNRHKSMDSRFFGFVDLTKVKAKALYIYWAKNKSRIGMEIK